MITWVLGTREGLGCNRIWGLRFERAWDAKASGVWEPGSEARVWHGNICLFIYIMLCYLFLCLFYVLLCCFMLLSLSGTAAASARLDGAESAPARLEIFLHNINIRMHFSFYSICFHIFMSLSLSIYIYIYIYWFSRRPKKGADHAVPPAERSRPYDVT